MGLFYTKKEKQEDSVYQRRVARGEVPAVSEQGLAYGKRIRELQNTVRELSDENSRLRSNIEKMQERMDGLSLSLSLEETINGFSEKPQAPSFNPFAAFASMRSGANSTASSESSDSDERIISDEEMMKIEDFLDGADLLEGEELE